ncbi:CsbD family protein [Paraburkholderia edwinii]|jgi:uncharacterized protein YjbJ (UPF0337 family)|uniref:CsbD family protein n=1 Tax=Paraburkholderia edwinii TaxID=2861782 RepID=A0ABX8UEB2_9BURK|nr:CsbD family protein [Paraburkholderia edwinii]QYD67056.1 CsbD family protein [Paraburkholderia edwinii]
METSKIEGTLQKSAGYVEKTLGDALGDTSAQVSGKAKELTGKAQKLYGDVRGVVKDSTAERPLMALGIAVGIGFVLGMLRAANRTER